MQCPKCGTETISQMHINYCKGDEKQLMLQALQDIAFQLKGIDYEDLSKAEKNIYKILNRFAIPTD